MILESFVHSFYEVHGSLHTIYLIIIIYLYFFISEKYNGVVFCQTAMKESIIKKGNRGPWVKQGWEPPIKKNF